MVWLHFGKRPRKFHSINLLICCGFIVGAADRFDAVDMLGGRLVGDESAAFVVV